MHYSVWRGMCTAALAALVLTSAGCGPRKYNVSGKVTYNGAVLDKPNGKIILLGPKGEQVDATINQDGTYAAEAMEGMNKVAVYYSNPRLQAEKPSKPQSGEKMKPPPTPYVTPEKYASPNTSGLSLTVEKDTVFDVDMKGPPAK